ncbi:Na/Pi cotransporter family protein [Paenibacillus aquistagni]|uniref:Phosphate:Na+ symporter n=1 Tax=Paenibacillus aquistagni TaxID=1852522 RepID=A0A1X7ICN1_9BACL|nr:Na/Pi symporter [Paenibacillus aquistagni]NMM51526.1 Na/Pi cotransporter family protein [Paenibacillus aquistagni]SMG12416.1 phosphate:Na+ symporter [Paenibacillus aquistagni]
MFYEIVLPLILGLAVFLFGMKTMEFALHLWAGPYLQRVLHRFTKTPMHGMLFSSVMTAAMQSSTAITVIAIGLVNAGLVTFPRTLGIILGTNIGTCLTTELIGLDITHYALPLLLLSITAWMWGVIADDIIPNIIPRVQHWWKPLQYASIALAGFSLVLLGMEWMKTISEPLQERGMFTWFLERSQESLVWALLAGMIITALVHSSAAIIAMAMGLAATGALPVEVGIAIVIGSNVGTCFTALIASLGGSRSGQYVAWSHIVLNVGGALLFYPFIDQLHHAASLMSSQEAGQIARAQTIFNIASSIAALPLCYLSVWKRLR